MPKYSFTGQTAKEFKPLPAGDYVFAVVDYAFGVSANGNEKIDLTLEVDGGAKVFDVLTFTPKAAWKIDIFLTSIGCSPELNKEFDFNKEFADTLIGKTGKMTLGIDEYEKDGQTKKRNKVVTYIDPKAAAKATAGMDESKIPF